VHACHIDYQGVGSTWSNEPDATYTDVVDSSTLTTEFVDYVRFVDVGYRDIRLSTFSPVTRRWRYNQADRGALGEFEYIRDGYGVW
jgi:hypothetical protein